MSPEQAKGREADKRSDIWAFGCVLYEMLTGKRPFDGEDVSDTLANVLKIDPDWSALPSEIPPAIRTLLQSCLTKDRRRRVADISTALFVLEKAASLAAPAGTAFVAPLPRRLLWRRVVTPVAAALVTSSVVGAGVWFATRAPEPRRLASRGCMLTPSGTAALTINGADRDLAITPDGSRVIYVGNRGTPGGAQTQRHAALRPCAGHPRAGAGVHRQAARAVCLPRWPVDRLHRRRRVEESADDRRAGRSPGGDRRPHASRRDVGTG